MASGVGMIGAGVTIGWGVSYTWRCQNGFAETWNDARPTVKKRILNDILRWENKTIVLERRKG